LIIVEGCYCYCQIENILEFNEFNCKRYLFFLISNQKGYIKDIFLTAKDIETPLVKFENFRTFEPIVSNFEI